MENSAILEVEPDAETASRIRPSDDNRSIRLVDAVGSMPGKGVHLTKRSRTPEDHYTEGRPLLDQGSNAYGSCESDTESEDEEDEYAHFKGMPWYKRPSIYWMLAPFLLLTMAFGGVMVPELNLILSLICREYLSDQAAADPNFTLIPISFDQPDPQCRIPGVQARVATFSLTMSLVGGILSAITSPKIGALSDRYGRKPFMFLGSAGILCNLILFISASSYPETFPIKVLFVGVAVDGLCGSFIAHMALANSYASDCTPPARRNVAFSLMHACLFTGIGFGPMLAGYVIKVTHQILSVFYIALGAQLTFLVFLALIVPESLSKSRQMAAREKHAREQLAKASSTTGSDRWTNLRSINLFEPLKILYPTGPGSSAAVRRNLIALAIVDTMMFGVAMGSITVIVIYTGYAFNWDVTEQSIFKSITNICRVIALIVILPTIIRLVRGPQSAQLASGRRASRDARKAGGADKLDLTLIRVAVALDTLGYVGYSLSKTGTAFTLSACVAAFGGIGSPTLQSALTKHVPNEKTGQLLGGIGLLHALARVVAPTIFNGIYAVTVGWWPQMVFVCLSVVFGGAWVASWFIRPGVCLDDNDVVREEPPTTPALEREAFLR